MTFQDELRALLTRHGVANKQGVSQPGAREFARVREPYLGGTEPTLARSALTKKTESAERMLVVVKNFFTNVE